MYGVHRDTPLNVPSWLAGCGAAGAVVNRAKVDAKARSPATVRTRLSGRRREIEASSDPSGIAEDRLETLTTPGMPASDGLGHG